MTNKPVNGNGPDEDTQPVAVPAPNVVGYAAVTFYDDETATWEFFPHGGLPQRSTMRHLYGMALRHLKIAAVNAWIIFQAKGGSK